MAKRSKNASSEKPKQVGVRLTPEQARLFEGALQRRAIENRNHLVADLLIQWAGAPDTDRGDDINPQPHSHEETIDLLVGAVTDHLISNKDWARYAVKSAKLALPLESVFHDRMGHFHAEKLFLAERFVPWLLDRIAIHMEQGCSIVLAIDSGTTLLAIFDVLGPLVAKLVNCGVDFRRTRLEIFTNNFPGAEAYETFAETEGGVVAINGQPHRLSELVPCELLPGQVLPRYSAVTGRRTQEHFVRCCSAARERGSTKIIGLVVGNWVMLSSDEAPPTPLARGVGHLDFKNLVISQADESYLISPLCKIIRKPLEEFNEEFIRATHRDRSPYEAATIPDINASRIKLVSTYRESRNSCVAVHSKEVLALCGYQTSPRAAAADNYRAFNGNSVETFGHLFYPFDIYSNAPRAKQLQVEVPHGEFHTDEMLWQYFSVLPPHDPGLISRG